MLDRWRSPTALIDRETRCVLGEMNTACPDVTEGLQELRQTVKTDDDRAVTVAAIKFFYAVTKLGEFSVPKMPMSAVRKHHPEWFQELVVQKASAAAALEYARAAVLELAHNTRVVALGLALDFCDDLETVTSREVMLRACDMVEEMWGRQLCVVRWKMSSEGWLARRPPQRK